MLSIDNVKLRGIGLFTAKRDKLGLHIAIWIAGAVLPFTPFAGILLQYSLADTPYAYLIWVPIFSFVWAAWILRRPGVYNDDSELNGIVAIPVMVFCAVFLLHGFSQNWRYEFLGRQLGLLFWPIWALSVAWLMFGVGVTRWLWKPLSYLWLSWPPLYSGIVNITNPPLDNIANGSLRGLAHVASWIVPTSTIGTYNVVHAGVGTPIYVSSVCSGADSFIAMVTLAPIILVTFHGRVMKKVLVLLFGIALAILGNLLRLGLIVFALHVFGPVFALDILHPVLGILLFLGILWLLLVAAKLIGLESDIPKRTANLHHPGYGRMGVTALSAVALTTSLWVFQPVGKGTPATPIPLKTSNLSVVMGEMPGWSRRIIGSYNESSILGTGSKTTAMTYTTLQGDYALCELWWTYQPLALQSYGVQDCLLFHGYTILGHEQMNLTKDIKANVYLAELPANQPGGPRQAFLDTEYSFLSKYDGRDAYLRVETATPVANVPAKGAATVAKLHQFMSQVPYLTRPPYPAAVHFHGVTTLRAVHLYNYFIFVRQFAGNLFGPSNVLHYPPFANGGAAQAPSTRVFEVKPTTTSVHSRTNARH